MWGVALTSKEKSLKALGSLFVEGGRLYVACGSGTVLELHVFNQQGSSSGYYEWIFKIVEG